MNNNKFQSGFTLIEAMVTITVLGIILSVAVPSAAKMITQNRISTASNEFLNTMMLARSEAVTRGIPVSICTSNNGTSCSTSLDDFAKGWIVFSDCNRNGQITSSVTTCDFDADGSNDKDTIINVANKLKDLSIVSTNNAATDYFTFLLNGRPETFGVNYDIGSKSGTATRRLQVSPTGRVKLCRIGETGC